MFVLAFAEMATSPGNARHMNVTFILLKQTGDNWWRNSALLQGGRVHPWAETAGGVRAMGEAASPTLEEEPGDTSRGTSLG